MKRFESASRPAQPWRPWASMRFPAALAASMLAASLLSACVNPPVMPAGYLTSRLPEGAQGAAAPVQQPLTPREQQRYDAIDRQVLNDQAQAMRDQAAIDAAAAAMPDTTVSIYGGYGWGGGWGGWRHGGWGPGWGVSYGYGPVWW